MKRVHEGAWGFFGGCIGIAWGFFRGALRVHEDEDALGMYGGALREHEGALRVHEDAFADVWGSIEGA